MDLSQVRIPYTPPVSPDSPNYMPTYDGYHDPNEDPSFEYSFQTPTFTKKEVQDSKAEVTGSYTYVDDVGERHNVQYEAGPRTGFHVKTLYPDSTPYTGLFYRGPPANKQTGPLRGKTSIQRGTDGSYRFTATGPDQRRTEVSDAAGNVRGSYTYLDDKGVQRTVQYIAGPNIGYKVIGGNKGIAPSGPTGGGGAFPYTPPDIETANPTSVPKETTRPLPASANLDEALFGKPEPNLQEPEKQQEEVVSERPDDFLNTPLYEFASAGNGNPQYSPPQSTSTELPTPSPTPPPTPIPSSTPPPSLLKDTFDDFLPPLSAFPEDDPSIVKKPPGGGSNSPIAPSYLTLEDDFLRTPFALLPLGGDSNINNYDFGNQFKKGKTNQNFPVGRDRDREFPSVRDREREYSSGRDREREFPTGRDRDREYPTIFRDHIYEKNRENVNNNNNNNNNNNHNHNNNNNNQNDNHSFTRDHKFSPSEKNFLGIPSGVAVRAHVQSLDILPFGSRIPSPAQALDLESLHPHLHRRERR
ncbi:uncharacterized protein LOC142331200 [Lycorma delicatula]|uniref:uncharacterized protein LOC142331200 n=1 Tax=Lycorma delicatula TaxID=130591 RepID=UPI003F5179BF